MPIFRQISVVKMDEAANHYIITGGEEGKKRLKLLSGVLQAHTKALLGLQGLTKGMRFLDLGSGGGDVSLMASRIVGEQGSVTSVDFDEKIVALAQSDAVSQSFKNIQFIVSGAYDINFREEFDMAYARFLLSHLTEPAAALERMVQSIVPGGKVVVEDLQFSGHFCYPRCEAFDTYIEYYTAAAKHNGHNPEIGPSLFSLFRKAGLTDIGFDIIQPCFNTGQGKWMAWITLDKVKDTLVKQDIATPQTISNTLHELEAFTKNEETIISLPRIFRVWGTKA